MAFPPNDPSQVQTMKNFELQLDKDKWDFLWGRRNLGLI